MEEDTITESTKHQGTVKLKINPGMDEDIKKQVYRQFLLPDLEDIQALIISVFVAIFIQRFIFSIKLGSILDYFFHSTFFPFLGLVYIAYWGYRWGYSSIYQAVADAEKRRERLVKMQFEENYSEDYENIGAFSVEFKIFGLILSLLILLVPFIFGLEIKK